MRHRFFAWHSITFASAANKWRTGVMQADTLVLGFAHAPDVTG
jgi:hypothetical protein